MICNISHYHYSEKRQANITCFVYEPARKKFLTGVFWSGLNGSLPGASRYKDCPILTTDDQAISKPWEDGNKAKTWYAVYVQSKIHTYLENKSRQKLFKITCWNGFWQRLGISSYKLMLHGTESNVRLLSLTKSAEVVNAFKESHPFYFVQMK